MIRVGRTVSSNKQEWDVASSEAGHSHPKSSSLLQPPSPALLTPQNSQEEALEPGYNYKDDHNESNVILGRSRVSTLYRLFLFFSSFSYISKGTAINIRSFLRPHCTSDTKRNQYFCLSGDILDKNLCIIITMILIKIISKCVYKFF